MATNKEVLTKFIEESIMNEYPGQSSKVHYIDTDQLKRKTSPRGPRNRPPTGSKVGTSRLSGADEKEFTIDQMGQQSKLEPGDTGISQKSGSVHDIKTGGWLDPQFLAKAGLLALHPKVGAFLDKKFGADKVNKFLGWAKSSHAEDLKSGKGAVRGDFKHDFGSIIKSRIKLFDQHLGQGVADDIMEMLFTIYQKEKQKRQK